VFICLASTVVGAFVIVKLPPDWGVSFVMDDCYGKDVQVPSLQFPLKGIFQLKLSRSNTRRSPPPAGFFHARAISEIPFFPETT
jgi:hypothetical protein